MALTKVSRGLLSTGIVDNSTTTAITIDSSENVGIGTSSPSKKFVVSEGGAHGFEISPFDGSQNATRLINYNRNTNEYFPLEIEASQIQFETAGTERMRIDSSGDAEFSGKVRVGTSTNGTAALMTFDSASNSSALQMGNNSGGVSPGGVLLYSTSSNEFQIYQYSGVVGSETYGGPTFALSSLGNVGIGVTSPAWGAAYANVNVGTAASFWGSKTGASLTVMSDNSYNNGSAYIARNTGAGSKYYQTAGAHYWDRAASVSAGATQTNVTGMTLDSSGNLIVGASSSLGSTGGAGITVEAGSREAFVAKSSGGATYSPVVVWNAATGGNNYFLYFSTEGGSYPGINRGSVIFNRGGGVVAYNTTSDYRAKDVSGPVANSGATIDALKVYNGIMKEATIERPMLIAHEAQEIVPYAVTGEKDAINNDGTPNYQQMDHQVLVPLLIAEIQSLRTRVQELENN